MSPPREKEPDFKRLLTDSEMTEAFNNYFYDYGQSEGVKFLTFYLTEIKDDEMVGLLKKADHNNISLTACWIARILWKGNLVPQSSLDFLNEELDKIRNRAKKVEPILIKKVRLDHSIEMVALEFMNIILTLDKGIEDAAVNFMKVI